MLGGILQQTPLGRHLPKSQPLQQTVCILLECILVVDIFQTHSSAIHFANDQFHKHKFNKVAHDIIPIRIQSNPYVQFTVIVHIQLTTFGQGGTAYTALWSCDQFTIK